MGRTDLERVCNVSVVPRQLGGILCGLVTPFRVNFTAHMFDARADSSLIIEMVRISALCLSLPKSVPLVIQNVRR